MAMRSRSSVSALLLAATLGITGALAAPRPQPSGNSLALTCPARLVTAQTASPVAGWEAFRSPKSAGRLGSYGFYDGPIAADAELAPTGGRKQGRVTIEQHDFSGHSGPIHFACRYNGTDLVLSKPLPSGIRQCTTVSNDLKPAAVDDVITCH